VQHLFPWIWKTGVCRRWAGYCMSKVRQSRSDQKNECCQFYGIQHWNLCRRCPQRFFM